MSLADRSTLNDTIHQFLDSQPAEQAMSRVEFHGLLCALACGPEPESNWQHVTTEDAIPAEIADAMEAMRHHQASRLGLGEAIQLPCRLDPFQDDDGNDLASWCAGFMAGVFLNEGSWYANDEELIASRLLPFVLISGLDDDPELDAIWQDSKLVRQMAGALPELLQEIFLIFHAPEVAEESAEKEE